MIQTERHTRQPNASRILRPLPEVPPMLESGDRMTRAEFERRYWLRPDLKKAELVEGVVYLSSPTRNLHGAATLCVGTWLGTYVSKHPNVTASDGGTVRLSDDTEVQPDVFLRLKPEAGGQSHIDADEFVSGAPELVVEVAYSSLSRDLKLKKPVYLAAGVREYIVWDLEGGEIQWFVLDGGSYVVREMDDEGIIDSTVFPGLRLDVVAMLEGDLELVLKVLTSAMTATRGGPNAAP
ncbi:MAG: Uma2 family endonuclease [Ardenticatenales bacterium]|nr:Uma2 family endonuclease [Ardenticatenales bacterium]